MAAAAGSAKYTGVAIEWSRRGWRSRARPRLQAVQVRTRCSDAAEPRQLPRRPTHHMPVAHRPPPASTPQTSTLPRLSGQGCLTTARRLQPVASPAATSGCIQQGAAPRVFCAGRHDAKRRHGQRAAVRSWIACSRATDGAHAIRHPWAEWIANSKTRLLPLGKHVCQASVSGAQIPITAVLSPLHILQHLL